MRIGVDLGGTKIEAIALSDDGGIRARRRIASPKHDYAKTIVAIRDLVHDITEDAGCTESTTVGVGIPGAISAATGTVKNANSTWLIGQALDKDLADALDKPVRVANDANCFAVSEAVDGAARGFDMVFGVILGTGVGGGIAIDGQTHQGLNAIAGEWGHNPLPWPQEIGGTAEQPGPRCYCGKQGCIETFLSGDGLSNDHASGGGVQLTPREIVDQAASGDAMAHAALERYVNRLARAIAGVINILDPDVIVFGGGLSNVEFIYDRLPKLISAYVFSDLCETPCIRNQHGDSSGVRGAAWLWPPEGTA